MNGGGTAARPRLRVHGSFGAPAGPARERAASAPGPSASAASGIAAPAPLASISSARGAARLLDVAAFAHDFRAMVGAGLGVPEILGIIAKSHERRTPRIAAALEDARRRVEQGSRLVDAFDPHRRVFGDLCVEMIGAGEQTGRLEEYLAAIAEDCEQRHKNRATVVSAMIEPALIVLVGIVVCYVILTFTVPQFKELYEALTREGTLPLATRALVATADALTSPLGVVVTVALVLGAIAGGVAIRSVPSIRYRVHCGLLRLPVLGELVVKDAVARGARTVGVVVKTIGDVPTALQLAARTCPNERIAEGFEQSAERVRQGRSIAGSLAETGVFPEMCVSMVETGERTGALDDLLPKLAEGYETQVRFARERLLMLLRPSLVIVMGGLVLGLMLAMYMPIFTLIEQLKR